jgi:hypothetical protein
MTIYLSSGRVKNLNTNFHLHALVWKVLLEASWSACNESDEVNGVLDIEEVLPLDTDGVI